MSDQADIINGIERLIGAINGTCAFINSIEEPPQDAEDVKFTLVTAKAKLSALQTRIMTQHRSEEFITKWSDSATKVLDYMRLTVGKLNSKLKVNPNGEYEQPRFGRTNWPFSEGDTLAIQHQMNEYTAMLGMVNNSFLSGSIPAVLRTSKQIDKLIKKTSTNTKDGRSSSRPKSMQPRLLHSATTDEVVPPIDYKPSGLRRSGMPTEAKTGATGTTPAADGTPQPSNSLRRTLTRKKTIRAGATLNMADLERLKVDLKGLQIGPIYPDACLVPKTRGTLAATTDLGRGILEIFISRTTGQCLAVYKNMHGNLQTICWEVTNIKFNPVDTLIKSIFARNPKYSKTHLPFRFYLRLYGTPRIIKGIQDATALKNADTVTFFFEYRAGDNWKGVQINENEIRDQLEREWHFLQTNGTVARRDSAPAY